MKAVACLILAFAGAVHAEEIADRAAIRKSLELLGSPELRDAQFAADADGKVLLLAALHSPRVPPSEPLSGDYWPYWPPNLDHSWTVEALAIRFITPDVALADARIADRALLFVYRREGAGWKIASVRPAGRR